MNLLIKLFINLRATYRILVFLGVIITYFIVASIRYVSTPDPIERRKKLVLNGQITAKWILKAFNVELRCQQQIPEEECSLLVGNHMGFIDIVCLLALTHGVFITSLEMKQTPFLGQITMLGGCAYVNRKNRMKIQDELKDIIQVLKDGFRVMLYAESVSTNGEQVLPFKKTLITAAGYAGRPIRPFVFNYRQVNGGPVKFEHRDSLCWYGDQTFFEAIWRSLKLNSLTCEIEFLPLVQTTPDADRSELASSLHATVSNSFVPFTKNMNLDEEQVLVSATASRAEV